MIFSTSINIDALYEFAQSSRCYEKINCGIEFKSLFIYIISYKNMQKALTPT